jgi:hypothetical protein
MSDAGTIRTRAASRKSSRSRGTRKVNSTFGVDLSNVFSFDAPEFVEKSKTKVTKKLSRDYLEQKLKELKNIYKSSNETTSRLTELIKM